MPQFNNVVGRADVSDALLPDQVSKEILKTAETQSTVLSRARRVPMSSKKSKQPVLAALPDAYWVNGDTGLKETTKAGWENVTMTAEELAAIVPIPDALIDDADVPLWDEIKPLLVEAIGKKVDTAALFGTDKPESWPTAVVPAAITAKNVVKRGTNTDIAADIAALAGLVSADGFAVNGFASKPGMHWDLVGSRTPNGAPLYSPALAPGQPQSLYGFPLNEVNNGAWNAEAAELLAADWTKFVVGVRQDITFDLFREGVITDDSGKVLVNLMQQDMKALRVVFRVGFQVANPMTRIGDADSRYPAGVLTPAEAE
ncbi:phage major capsid protein [Corynebacterium sp. TAE3-ERU12]|uniref:phage major capsid protein n=1 Tax=Corynebacterium sp. TAE3-ERU12 TaxID=2849491 RepID=UPI001C483CC4|nr:phage major capsid protein [Corynebacterium sp. TAE3-ERU12]MBV7294924.1 phage major capsid protein [Corynebacterium sp. TAE3-ERU12]